MADPVLPLTAEGLEQFFREHGWVIQMDDRPGQAMWPFDTLALALAAARAAQPPASVGDLAALRDGPHNHPFLTDAGFASSDEPHCPACIARRILREYGRLAAAGVSLPSPEPPGPLCGWTQPHGPHPFSTRSETCGGYR